MSMLEAATKQLLVKNEKTSYVSCSYSDFWGVQLCETVAVTCS
jgi:hypothetical protein